MLPASDARLDRLQVLAVILPLIYIVGLVAVVVAFDFPLWAAAGVTMAVSVPVIIAFAWAVFTLIDRMRSTLVRREAKFRGLLESAPDAIVIVDTEGRIVIVNEQTSRVFGYRSDELIGQPVELLLPQEMHRKHTAHRYSFYEHPGTRPMAAGLSLVARRKNGEIFPAEISLSPIETEDGMLVTSTVRDISDRKRAEEERERLLAETEAQRERERIGMDLHDGVIQSIYAVGLSLEAAASDTQDHPAAVPARLDRSIEQLNEVIRDIRSYIMNLRPTRFTGDIGESLAALGHEFRVNSLLETTVYVNGIPPLDEERSLALFQIAQEALNNVRRHARASSVTVELRRDGGDALLEVRDNGDGFDTEAERAGEHQGLRNMSSRARAAGGTLSIESQPRRGTTVRARMPVSQG